MASAPGHGAEAPCSPGGLSHTIARPDGRASTEGPQSSASDSLAATTISEPRRSDVAPKRPRFAAVEVKRTSESDVVLSSFADLTRQPSRPAVQSLNDLDMDAELAIRRKKPAARPAPRTSESEKSSIAAPQPAPEAPAAVEAPESLSGAGNGLLDDWTCKRTAVFSSMTPFAWLESSTGRDRAAAALAACALAQTPTPAAHAADAASSLMDFERLRISFSQAAATWTGDDTPAKTAWLASAAALCAQLEHGLTPYFCALGKPSVLFLAANAHSSCTSTTAIVSQSSRGLRSALNTAGVAFTSLYGGVEAPLNTAHRSDLRILARLPGVTVRETEEMERNEHEAPLILSGDSALKLLGTGLVGCPQLLSPRPFVGCTIVRAEVTHSPVQRGADQFHTLRVHGWLLPTQVSGLAQVVQDIHKHDWSLLCPAAEHAMFNALPGLSPLSGRHVKEVKSQAGQLSWKAV